MNLLEQPGSRWHIAKYTGIAGNYLLMMFYTMVAGWMLYYTYLYTSGKMELVNAEETSDYFSKLLDSLGTMTLFAAIVIVRRIEQLESEKITFDQPDPDFFVVFTFDSGI